MLIALDTSAHVVVALVGDDGPLAGRRVAEPRRHAELLAPLVAEVLAEAGAGRQDVTGVVVGTGPAPFTGLRAGLVTARTLAFALGVPVHGVGSLDALAAQAFADGTAADDDEVLVLADARRREVYHARFRRSGDDVAGTAGPSVGPAVDLDVAGAVVVGPGGAPYGLPAADGAPLEVDPAVLARLALVRCRAGRDQPTEPLYLRRPDVTPSAARKRATG